MKKLSLLLLAAVMVVILTVSMASVTSAATPLVPYQLEEYGQLSYNIYEAVKNPTVDGVVSEGEYGDPIRVFNLGDEGTMVDGVLSEMDEATRKIVVSRDCTVYMTFNDVYLYVAVTCIDDSHMTPGYGQEVWDGDYLEFDMIRISDDFSETQKEKRLVFAIGINNDGEMCAWYDRVPEYSDGSCAGVIWQEANNNATVTLKDKLATYEFRLPWKGILGTNGAPESALYYVNVSCSDEEYYEMSEYACLLGSLRNTPPASDELKAEIEALGGKATIYNRLYFIKNAPDTSAAESAYSFTEGLVSAPGKPVKTARALEQMPRTFDVIVQLSPNYEERAGVIVGNYAGSSAAISFEVQAGGLPRLYYKDEAENVYNHVFENVDMRSKTPVRLTLVQDPASKTITCYIDGKEVGKMDCAEGFPDALIPSNEQMIGGDFRDGNGQYFKGTIYKVDLYSDALTADQIASGNGTGLLASYDFTTEANKSADLSGNGYDLISEMDFLNAPTAPAAESAYSFTEGLVSDPDKPVKTARALEQMPRTFDVIVQLSPDYEERAGVIVGNYAGSSAAISFEVQAGGLPRLYYKDEAENVYNHVFEDVDMRSKTPVRLTLVQDPASKTITCYIDGKEVGKMDCAEGFPDALIPSNEQMIGGDFRDGNGQYFKGTIYKVDLYSDALTADQIASGNGTGLLASYDFTTETNKSADLSGNGYDLISEMDFLNAGSVISKEPAEPAYTNPASGEEAPTSSQLDEVLEAKAEAPNTFDFGVVAAVAAVISLGGFAASRKHK